MIGLLNEFAALWLSIPRPADPVMVMASPDMEYPPANSISATLSPEMSSVLVS